MNRLPETVNQQFNQLFAAIGHAADDLKIESAEASLMGDFASVTARMEDCKRLQTLEAELRACLKRFGDKQPSKAVIRSVRAHTRRYTRKSGGKLKVTVGAKTIEQATISDTFVQTLATLGLDKVARLNKKLSGIPLLARTPASGYQTQKFHQGWYVTTHFNQPTAIKMLQEVGRELHVPLRVEAIDR
ncbi:hypothetical protein [Methylomonas sp. UP202]|uniref:hypothetical protein n=1 Tax=Methylomonas sp. UP202 TaxID=3040943 RepID=UPI00247901E7|nr:hypothetical protein [Methylomonas sp. UP202]WGS88589.1 hypothetical protein QC632_24910 [Methylomonas sp. UP202]